MSGTKDKDSLNIKPATDGSTKTDNTDNGDDGGSSSGGGGNGSYSSSSSSSSGGGDTTTNTSTVKTTDTSKIKDRSFIKTQNDITAMGKVNAENKNSIRSLLADILRNKANYEQALLDSENIANRNIKSANRLADDTWYRQTQNLQTANSALRTSNNGYTSGMDTLNALTARQDDINDTSNLSQLGQNVNNILSNLYQSNSENAAKYNDAMGQITSTLYNIANNYVSGIESALGNTAASDQLTRHGGTTTNTTSQTTNSSDNSSSSTGTNTTTGTTVNSTTGSMRTTTNGNPYILGTNGKSQQANANAYQKAQNKVASAKDAVMTAKAQLKAADKGSKAYKKARTKYEKAQKALAKAKKQATKARKAARSSNGLDYEGIARSLDMKSNAFDLDDDGYAKITGGRVTTEAPEYQGNYRPVSAIRTAMNNVYGRA